MLNNVLHHDSGQSLINTTLLYKAGKILMNSSGTFLSNSAVKPSSSPHFPIFNPSSALVFAMVGTGPETMPPTYMQNHPGVDMSRCVEQLRFAIWPLHTNLLGQVSGKRVLPIKKSWGGSGKQPNSEMCGKRTSGSESGQLTHQFS